MEIGIAREHIHGERSVAMLPQEIRILVNEGHLVYVEENAGVGINVSNEDYRAVGASVIKQSEIYDKDIVVKIKAPTKEESKMLKKGTVVLAMMHFEQNPEIREYLREARVSAVAFEEVRNTCGERLVEVNRITAEQGLIMAFYLSGKSSSECNILQLGYGAVGIPAVEIASALGANIKVLRRCEYVYMINHLQNKDIVINAIRWPKEKREKKEYLITREMLKKLNKGAIVLDLAVDYPSPIETCHPTFLDNPVYEVDGIKHVCLHGFFGLVPKSSSERLSKKILPIILDIAKNGLGNVCPETRNAIVP